MRLRIAIISLCMAFITAGSKMQAQEVIVLTEDNTVQTDWTTEVHEPTWDELLHQRLCALAEEADRNYYYTGLSIYDLTSDSLIFAYNQHKLMRPASTQKVMTAITALDLLGVNHQYSTNIYMKGQLTEGTLSGSIYVVGDFDPMLDRSHISKIVESVKQAGIREADNLFVDLSMKDTLSLGSGWCWDDEQPFLTPLSLSGKAYECNSDRINRYHPDAHFTATLISALQAENIKIHNTGTSAFTPGNDSRQLCSITHPLREVLEPMMKDSNNLYAESMFYQLGAEKRKGASGKDCVSMIESVMEKAHIPADMASIADGCGLSLYNYVTPGTLVALLRYAYHKEGVFAPLYHSMPIAGIDGTLTNRMKKTAAQSNVHAKTGTVTGVTSLAGYLTAANGHLIAFSIICNGHKKAAEGRAFQDRVCITLCE